MIKVNNYAGIEFLDIPGFGGAYKASNKKGLIMSTERKVFHGHGLSAVKILPEKIMKVRKNNKGYLILNLQLDGVKVRRLVSRLVALTFIENPLNLPCINHVDAIILNNDASNLEWCTVQENAIHASKMGLLHSPSGESNIFAKLTNDEARQIRAAPDVSSKVLAELYDISRTQINLIKRGKTYKCA